MQRNSWTEPAVCRPRNGRSEITIHDHIHFSSRDNCWSQSQNEVYVYLTDAATQCEALKKLVEGESSNQRSDGTWALRNAQWQANDHRVWYNPKLENLVNNGENISTGHTTRFTYSSIGSILQRASHFISLLFISNTTNRNHLKTL